MKRFSARTVSWYSIVLEGLFIVVVYAFLYVNVQSIERMVGESREAHLPSIQEGQRTLLNLEYLRHSVSQLRQAPNEEYLRSTYTGIRALLAEISFDKRVDEITLRDLGTPACGGCRGVVAELRQSDGKLRCRAAGTDTAAG